MTQKWVNVQTKIRNRKISESSLCTMASNKAKQKWLFTKLISEFEHVQMAWIKVVLIGENGWKSQGANWWDVFETTKFDLERRIFIVTNQIFEK